MLLVYIGTGEVRSSKLTAQPDLKAADAEHSLFTANGRQPQGSTDEVILTHLPCVLLAVKAEE